MSRIVCCDFVAVASFLSLNLSHFFDDNLLIWGSNLDGL